MSTSTSCSDYRCQESSELLLGKNKNYSSITASRDCCTQHQIVTTRVRVANLCCGGEERIIRGVLSEMAGIENFSVNIVSKIVIVRHCYLDCCTRTITIVEELNKKHLGASIQEVSNPNPNLNPNYTPNLNLNHNHNTNTKPN
jgi:hypothetical protein